MMLAGDTDCSVNQGSRNNVQPTVPIKVFRCISSRGKRRLASGYYPFVTTPMMQLKLPSYLKVVGVVIQVVYFGDFEESGGVIDMACERMQ